MRNLDSHKLLHHLDRVVEWQHGNRIPPITMDIALTRACNYKCVYCYGQLQENEAKPIDWKVIKRFLHDARDIGVKAISLVSDGESTCSPHYINTIVYGKSLGLDMALGTNGYLLDRRALGKVLTYLTYLRFNISGATPESYAKWHGVEEKAYAQVIGNIHAAVDIKRAFDLPVTIGLQMVFMPDMVDEIIPLAKLGKRLGVDYLVIKHCSDDELHTLGINYEEYSNYKIIRTLKDAEGMSDDKYQVSVKWSKILSGGQRSYSRCYGAQFIMQLSGSGLVAPCGMLFNEKYKKYHIGNIVDTSFKELFYSDRYMEVMKLLASDQFDAKTMCGSLCLQHKCNEFLNELIDKPDHINFV